MTCATDGKEVGGGCAEHVCANVRARRKRNTYTIHHEAIIQAQASITFALGLRLLCSRSTMAGYHFTPFEVGQIKAHAHHGLGPAAIRKVLLKPDGISRWSFNGISDIVKKLDAEPSWRGERAPGSGAARKTTAKEDKQIEKFILKWRGEKKVTVRFIKKEFPKLRKLSDTLVEERIQEADLKWLRRRRKSKVGTTYLQPRVEYCQGVKRKHQSTLDLWAYTDGTVYYLEQVRSSSTLTNTIFKH